MKKLFFLPLLLLLLTGGCQNREQEARFKKREAELSQKEQELILRENTLALREQSLLKEEHAIDSVRQVLPAVDSAAVNNLAGIWTARMNCVETDCSGSAIGDSKNEQWEISYEQTAVLVKALVNNKVVRVYSGKLAGSSLELTAQHTENEALPDAVITAQLQVTNGQRLEGRREINRPGTCRIVYALELTKK